MNACLPISLPETLAGESFIRTLSELGLASCAPGSKRWWRSVAELGTPLILSDGSGESLVTFIWRDPAGERALSDLHQVYIEVSGHTPHPGRSPTLMQRYRNTDVWFWQTQLPDDWQSSYRILPARIHELPPRQSGFRSPSDYALAVRNWWMLLAGTRGCSDPLNLIPPHTDGWGQPLSALQLPFADVPLSEQSLMARPLPARGKLHHWRWYNSLGANERDVWLYRSGLADSQQPLPLVILLDGQHWAADAGFFATLDQMTARHELPAAVYLLIDAVDADTRSRELACSPEFWLTLQQELLPQAQRLQPFSDDPQKTVIAGQHFGGLAALYAALNWPQRFGAVLSQSGAFWWPDVNEVAVNGCLCKDVKAAGGRRYNMKVELQTGSAEKQLNPLNQAMYKALQAAGARIEYHQYSGGHDWLCWRSGLFKGLKNLLA
tara:strand:+ start:15491 stop:16798 length:1308 start_codon:yes stop_codon:yes gene_type:complete